MPRFFKLKPSRLELQATYGLLAVAAIMTWLYVALALQQFFYLTAIAMLTISETRAYQREGIVYLCIDAHRCGLVSSGAEQSYFSTKNKVYPTRWFAILKLCYQRKKQTVMLLPDRFESLRDYQDCRYLLVNQVRQ